MTTTLDRITRALSQQGVAQDEVADKIHTAGMLAFVEAASTIVNRSAMPTPLYRLEYDETTHTVDFTNANGRAYVPNPNALDMNMLDTLVASLLKEKMPLMFEGKTGVGKTYTVEQFFKTILPKNNFRGLRLNRNMSNVLQPYTQGKIDNGQVRIELNEEACDEVAAIFIDEANRGDTNMILALQDGVVRLSSGEARDLGIPIPQYVKQADGTMIWDTNPEEKRAPFVVLAQNPPATKDAKYSATKRTDAAQNNRNLQIDMPNSASKIGESVLLLDAENGHHRRFLDEYRKEFARLTGIEQDTLATINQDWINMYAFVTDPKKTACPSIQSAVEFTGAMLTMVSPTLAEDFEYNKQTVEDWNKVLKGYGVQFKFDGTLDETATSMEKIRTIVTGFEEDIITRDIGKVKKLSDAVSLTRRIKGSLATSDPVATYDQTPNFITVQDAAAGFAIMLDDKMEKDGQKPATIIDTVMKEYTSVVQNFANKIGYQAKFSSHDPNMSVYQLAFKRACINMSKQSGLGGMIRSAVSGGTNYPLTTGFLRDLAASVAELRRLEKGNEYRKPILARMVADITTLAGFADQYKDQLESQLARASDDTEKRNIIKSFYKEQRGKTSTPDIYQQRLTRVLGV